MSESTTVKTGVGVAVLVAAAVGLVAIDAQASDDVIEPTSAAVAELGAEKSQATTAEPAEGTAKKAKVDCADKKTCNLVFPASSKQSVKPFGLTVKLVSANAKSATISVEGTKYVLKPGKAVKVEGATAKLSGAPGKVVAITFKKA